MVKYYWARGWAVNDKMKEGWVLVHSVPQKPLDATPYSAYHLMMEIGKNV